MALFTHLHLFTHHCFARKLFSHRNYLCKIINSRAIYVSSVVFAKQLLLDKVQARLGQELHLDLNELFAHVEVCRRLAEVIHGFYVGSGGHESFHAPLPGVDVIKLFFSHQKQMF